MVSLKTIRIINGLYLHCAINKPIYAYLVWHFIFRPLLTFDNKISKPVEVNGQTVKEHSDIMKTIANKNSCFWYIVGGEGFFTVFKNTNAFFDDSIPCFILGSWF